MAVNNSKALAKQTAAVPATKEQVPSYLQIAPAGGGRGFEEADKDDFVLPRLSLCQALTPQRQKRNPNFIDGLEEGDFFNSVTGEIYGKKIQVIPIFLARQRIKFKGKIGEGIDCISSNGKNGGQLHPSDCRTCPHAQWGSGKDGQGQACTEFKNIVLVIRGHESSPIIFSNKSTALGVTKQWLTLMKMANMDMFAAIYEIESDTTVKNDNEFYTWKFKRLGFVPEDLYLKAKAFFENLHDKNVTFNPDEFEDGDLAAGDAGDAGM